MTHEEREAKERRLIEINRCLGILAPQDILAPLEGGNRAALPAKLCEPI
jgi:hypothetical protein